MRHPFSSPLELQFKLDVREYQYGQMNAVFMPRSFLGWVLLLLAMVLAISLAELATGEVSLAVVVGIIAIACVYRGPSVKRAFQRHKQLQESYPNGIETVVVLDSYGVRISSNLQESQVRWRDVAGVQRPHRTLLTITSNAEKFPIPVDAIGKSMRLREFRKRVKKAIKMDQGVGV